MLDLNLFYQSSNESWADMMDEEDETFDSSTSDDPDAVAKNERKSSTNVTAKEQEAKNKTITTTTAATHDAGSGAAATTSSVEAIEPRSLSKTESKKSNESDGIVWRLPSAKEREEQKAVMELLIEQRRLNIDKLDSWRRKDDNDKPRVGASDLATNWRRPIRKDERIPVRPVENNNVQGWASYSETLQKEYDEECEAAKQEFIRRFGSSSSSTGKEEKIDKPAPVEILITADGPSDWADDIPASGEESNDDVQEDEETQGEKENSSERAVLEEKLPKELVAKTILQNVDDVKDDQGTMEQPGPADLQYQEEEEQQRPDAAIDVVTEAAGRKLTDTPPMVHVVVQKEDAVLWNDDSLSINDSSNGGGSSNHDTPENKNGEEIEPKADSPPSAPVQDAPSRWISFALEETRKTQVVSCSPGNNKATTASSSTSTVESKGQDTSRYFSDDSNGIRPLSHSSSNTTETSGENVHQLHQHHHHPSPPPPAAAAPPPPQQRKVRSALSQITSYLLKDAPNKNLLSTPGHARAIQEQQQPRQKTESTRMGTLGEDHKIQVSPAARESPITIVRRPATDDDHLESNRRSPLSPSSAQAGWSRRSTSPLHDDRARRLAASPSAAAANGSSNSSGWQCHSPRTRFQGRGDRDGPPSSRETQERANTSWQSFARDHSAHSAQPYRQS